MIGTECVTDIDLQRKKIILESILNRVSFFKADVKWGISKSWLKLKPNHRKEDHPS